MSDMTTRGPANPSRIIFVTTVLISVAVGFGTGDIRWFMLTVIGSAALLCTGYGLLRRRLGWRPLNVEYLADRMRVISPP